MSLTFREMQHLLPEVQQTLCGSLCESVESFGKNGVLFLFSKGEQNFSFLISLESPFLRFHLREFFRSFSASTPFVQDLMILKGCSISSCSLLNEDRILSVIFCHRSRSYQFIAEFFSHRPNGYLIDPSTNEVLTSLYPIEDKVYRVPPKPSNFDSNGGTEISGSMRGHTSPIRFQMSREVDIFFIEKEREALFLKKKKRLETHVGKNLRQASKNASKYRERVKECEQWESFHHDALLLQSQLFRMDKKRQEITLLDWNTGLERTLSLIPGIEPYLQVKKRFDHARKLRLGESYARKLLEQSHEELAKWERLERRVAEAQEDAELDALFLSIGLTLEQESSKKQIPEKKPKLPYRTYYSEDGAEIWVGKTDKDNERMTFSYANGSDWWFHARDYPGSHVVLRSKKGVLPSREALNEAGKLALKFSKAKEHLHGEVSYTQVKYVSKIRGAVGKVNISKSQVLIVSLKT